MNIINFQSQNLDVVQELLLPPKQICPRPENALVHLVQLRVQGLDGLLQIPQVLFKLVVVREIGGGRTRTR